MKCSKCGRNFGNGMNCQYCGVDRVTGLANYGGYDNPRQGYESDNGGYGSPSTMVCYACGNIIPANSEYCPFCSRELYVTCPQCGNIYSSQYPVCYKCGTNREKYFKQKEKEKQDAIRKERERERKQKEWEQSQEYYEQKIKNEAYYLKTDLEQKYGCMSVIPGGLLLAGGIIGMANILPEISIPVSTKVIIVFVTVAVLAFTLYLLVELFKKLGIDNWKSNNPNDPRCKYL